MRLPFTREQFFDAFAGYNETLWPVALALWIASLLTCGLLPTSRRPSDRFISGLLAIHWSWSALAYHVGYFSRINPAAWLFAALFLIQAGIFIWWGVRHSWLRFAPNRSLGAFPGWALIAYALSYPAINAAQHSSVTRIPTFGVPCPTTILTAGLIMLGTSHSWRVSIVPIVWSAIGGSAAFLLGVRADYVLPLAGAALVRFSFHRVG